MPIGRANHPLKFRSVFLSDIHLGSRGCQAAHLLAFLKQVQVEYLYLVGDIVDVWRLKDDTYWPQEHNNVLRLVLSKAKRGAQVVYVPGNHDVVFRDYVGRQFGNVQVCREALHTTATGRQLLVVHGDDFDNVIRLTVRWGRLGERVYDLALNRIGTWMQRAPGLRHWSFASYLQQQSGARRYIERYERTWVQQARARHLDGVVCGHVHQPKLMRMGNIQYFNCGDWVQNCTSIVEDFNGRLSLLRWSGQQPVSEYLETGAHAVDVPPVPQQNDAELHDVA